MIKTKSLADKPSVLTEIDLATPMKSVFVEHLGRHQQEWDDPQPPSNYAQNQLQAAAEDTVHRFEVATLSSTHRIAQFGGSSHQSSSTALKNSTQHPSHVATSKQTIKTKPTQILRKSSTIKTAKTADATAKASTKAATQAQQQSIKMSKTTAKTTTETAESIKKIVVHAVRALVDALKSLLTAIIAGGWVAVVIILLLCLLGLLLGSSYGIFLSSDDGEYSVQGAVQEIDAQYNDAINDILSAVSYDELELNGSNATWQQVLALYAVLLSGDEQNPEQVVTMDEEKQAYLQALYWQITSINYYTEVRIESIAGEGESEEPLDTETAVTYLIIEVSQLSVDEMIATFELNEEQVETLTAMLADENNELWMAVLYGTWASDNQIVAVALSQVGNVGGQPYWSWFGCTSRIEWCACFVSWCADQCGYVDAGIIPKFSYCVWGVTWFQENGQWADSSIQPEAGMLIFFDWEQDGIPDHVGIVEQCTDGMVYTIEGNSGDACKQNSYTLTNPAIFGYGLPDYP